MRPPWYRGAPALSRAPPATAPAPAPGAADEGAAFAHVAWVILIAGLIGVTSALALGGDARQGGSGTGHHRPHLGPIHAKSIAVDFEYYEDSRYYAALHRAQQEASYRPTCIVNDLTIMG